MARTRRLWAVGRLAPTLAVVAVLAAPGTVRAQTVAAAEGAWEPAPGLEARVRAAVAERWAVEPARVRLEWGVVRGHRSVPADAPFRFIGSGAGGSWVVAFEPARGGAVHVRLRAGVEASRPVAARDLERGTILGGDDIAWRTTVAWGPPEPARAVEPGWVTRRRIPLGQPLEAPAVAPPDVVEAGAPVRVLWRRGGIVLTLTGRALGSAALGQRVTFRTETGRRLEGVAAGPSLIHVEATPGRSP